MAEVHLDAHYYCIIQVDASRALEDRLVVELTLFLQHHHDCMSLQHVSSLFVAC